MPIKKALLAILVFAACADLNAACLRETPSHRNINAAEILTRTKGHQSPPIDDAHLIETPSKPLSLTALKAHVIKKLESLPSAKCILTEEALETIKIAIQLHEQNPDLSFALYKFFNVYFEEVIMTERVVRTHKEETIFTPTSASTSQKETIKTTSELHLAHKSPEFLKDFNYELLLLIKVIRVIEPILKTMPSEACLGMPFELIEEQFIYKKRTIYSLYEKLKQGSKK